GLTAQPISYKALGGSFANITLSASNTASDTFTVTAISPALNLVGNGGGDTFILQNNATVKSITGGTGTDTLVGRNATNAWNITSANAGNITGVVASFTGVENLTRGNQAD